MTVDCSAGKGEIYGAQIAQTGVLSIISSSSISEDLTLPLSLHDLIDGENLMNWKVFMDGRGVSKNIKLKADGTVCLVDMGTIFILR